MQPCFSVTRLLKFFKVVFILLPFWWMIWTASKHYISLPFINAVNKFRTDLDVGLTTWGLTHSLSRGHNQEQSFVSHHSELAGPPHGKQTILVSLLAKECSGLRQKSGTHLAWPQLCSRLLLHPWASGFTLCTISPHFNIEEVRFRERTED